ncbi:hypothetical protein J4G37_24630 [Microvirga sp. 3-52]|nr:hypothetical protein [Microvirga sp. 3-52]
MSAMDRERQSHASHSAGFENLTLAELETTFEAVLADILVSATRLNELEQTWSERKPRTPDALVTTRADALFDLCHENEVGYFYTVRDIPALYEAAKATPHLWPRVQSIVTALHRQQHETSRLADEIGLTAAYQESTAHQRALVEAGDAILRLPANAMAILAAKARVLAWSLNLKLDQDPWSLGSPDSRALLILVQDLLSASPPPRASM